MRALNIWRSGMDILVILASLMKYIFITIIYIFIFAIIRMIYLDIRNMNVRKNRMAPKNCAYLELLNDMNTLYFDVKQFYPMTSELIVIGRSSDFTIQIDDFYLSGKHVQLWYEDEECHIQDMGSTNGTYINGKKMKKTVYVCVQLSNCCTADISTTI